MVLVNADIVSIKSKIVELSAKEKTYENMLNKIRNNISSLEMIITDAPKDYDDSTMPQDRLLALKTSLLENARVILE